VNRCATFWLLLSALQAQGKEDHTLRDFGRFDEEIQHSLVRNLERRIQLYPNPAIQRIVSMQRDRFKLPAASEPSYHRAAKWAQGVAPTREFIVAGDERHSAIRQRFPAQALLPDLHKAVWYEWATSRIVRRAKPLSTREMMENIYHGYPPGSDDTLAHLLKKFDNNPKMRLMGQYLSHLYADLSAQVFEGVTLYEAWYSGDIIDVPDVDAIPFERKILKSRRFKSPIPAGRRRTTLYMKVRDRAFEYRKYRTLREAAAVAFLRADPKMDPTYELLVPRFHYLYVVFNDDTDAVAKLLRDVTDRDALIQRVDKRIKGSSTEYQKRLQRKKHLSDMYAWLHYWAQLVVYEQTKK
jgi:hypothetical protein